VLPAHPAAAATTRSHNDHLSLLDEIVRLAREVLSIASGVASVGLGIRTKATPPTAAPSQKVPVAF